MAIANTRFRYGDVAMALHWLIALGVLLNLALGIDMANFLSDNDPVRFTIVQIHKSVGLTVLWLSVLRVIWRIVNPVPPLPDSLGRGLKFLAHASHYFLYFLILAIPLSGWALVSASPLGLPISYFGLFHWPSMPFLADLTRAQKMPLHHDLFHVHEYLAFSAIALFVIHVAGALYHQFHGDDVLRRMLPGTRIAGEA